MFPTTGTSTGKPDLEGLEFPEAMAKLPSITKADVAKG